MDPKTTDPEVQLSGLPVVGIIEPDGSLTLLPEGEEVLSLLDLYRELGGEG